MHETEDRKPRTDDRIWQNLEPTYVRAWHLPRSIFVENLLQIGPLFFKTKPICGQHKIQVSSVVTKDYEEKPRPAGESKQSQTNPISMSRWANFSGLNELRLATCSAGQPISILPPNGALGAGNFLSGLIEDLAIYDWAVSP